MTSTTSSRPVVSVPIFRFLSTDLLPVDALRGGGTLRALGHPLATDLLGAVADW
ncbi:hypothetical protein ACFVXG_22190 [Kitasatospora sp. NPDC058162]|uniref:hypothetical protein n=1 Tax=Kitasatospora sp. NPDC058162 TaxID=3346362 RepID=UPI0036DD2C66